MGSSLSGDMYRTHSHTRSSKRVYLHFQKRCIVTRLVYQPGFTFCITLTAHMSTEQLLLAILSSSVIGGAIGAVIAGRFSLSVKDREYENEYYKLVLAKRITAYESINQLVGGLKTAVLDEDSQPYHLLLSHEDGLPEAHKLLSEISSQALWLSDDLFLQTRDLGRLLFSATSQEGDTVIFAKKNYQKLATFREEIERLQIRDMLSLHKVKQFLNAKKIQSGFSNVRLSG